LEDMAVPVIALVNGFALGGGCELAIACDWIIASERAQFGQPEVNLGISPGFGGTQRLPRLIGKALALEMVTTGRIVKAEEALRISLVNHVVPADQLLAKGMEQARLIASKAPLAVKLSKAMLHTGYDMDLENGLRHEADNFALLCTTQDRAEGMTAFLEKRKANFKGQ
jgi:enoyl-CoA hydratase